MPQMQKLEAIVGPHSLERYAPILFLMQFLIFIIGCFFWVEAVGDETSFAQSTWGDFAWGLSAEFWAAVSICSTSLTMIGLMNPIHRNLVLFGATIHIVEHLGLSYSAFLTGGDLAVGLFSSVFFLTMNIVLVAGVLSEWRQ